MMIYFDFDTPIGGVNYAGLERDAHDAGLDRFVCVNELLNGAQVRFLFRDGSSANRTQCQTVLDNHVPSLLTLSQRARQIAEGASDEARTVPDFMGWTPAEADAWVDANVSDLPTAKLVIRKLAMNVAALNAKVFARIRAEKE